MCSSRSENQDFRGKNVLLGFAKESGRKKPYMNPEAMVKPPIRMKSQNQPGRLATPRIWRIPYARSFDDAWPN